MLDLEDTYNSMTETRTMSVESEDLLERILSITSPMKFDTNFANDEQLESLLQELENTVASRPKIERVIFKTCDLKAAASNKADFI